MLMAAMMCVVEGAWAAELHREDIIRLLATATAGQVADLHELSARGADLSNIDFQGADLRGIDLKGANLSSAKLAKANLDLSILSNANLAMADLSDASIYGAVWLEAGLENADLSRALLVGNLSGARLNHARLLQARAGANMKNQSMGLIRLVFTYAILEGADLSDADLSVCDGRFAVFTNAILHGTNLSGCDLRHADFTGADLTGVNMAGAKLESANFTNIQGRETIKGLDQAEGFSDVIMDK